ncbi:TIGR02449 family protein [Pseudomaricurvus alkylphenolicus]|jgi:cell division protein ZapB|uniref:TIGR02449 family protein n=1 Tax=Pseudomaricurvus alkylphenolicus TaxID=1306991 RepID=UPI0014209FCD|nr:TIGR02449 family protein [Pseudomaricurvus alkylphenolicus]NIB39640.1 TIGR02449 family protein [Pseudomaricurvus alkylphenolicus]
MTNQHLLTLEIKLDQLIDQCERLRLENDALKEDAAAAQEREASWQGERTRLIEKNELARNRVEAMISRLKSLESQN